MQLQLPRRGRGVDALGERHERDPHGVEFLEQGDQVLQVAAESVKTPAHKHIEPASFRVGHQRAGLSCCAEKQIGVRRKAVYLLELNVGELLVGDEEPSSGEY